MKFFNFLFKNMAIVLPNTAKSGKNNVKNVEIALERSYFSFKIVGIHVVKPSLTKLLAIAKTANIENIKTNPLAILKSSFTFSSCF